MTSTAKRLVRSSDLTIRIRPGSIKILARGGSATCGEVALAVLDCFATAQSVPEAMAHLWTASDGRAQWVRCSSTIVQLERIGALVAVDGCERVTLGTRFGGAEVHVRMLDDRARTDAFIEAVSRTVTPDDVVLDIGTGTGILAMAAARAGARVVYAVESAAIGQAAQALFTANGYGSKITLIQGWSTAVSLPEPATILVTETVGSEVFDEQIVDIIADAQSRLLVNDAVLIPRGIGVFAVPVTVADNYVHARRFTAAATERWQDAYGFDFRPLVDLGLGDGARLWLPATASALIPALADAVRMVEVRLADKPTGEFDQTGIVAVKESGEVNAVLTYFELDLAAGVALSTAPAHRASANSWGNQTLLLESPIRVVPGDHLEIRLCRTQGRFRATCSRVHQPLRDHKI